MAHVLAKDLRETVLQAAIQGKLTQRCLSDTCVDTLIDAITDNKARLIAEKKIKKEKSIDPISEEECDILIPDGWRLVRFAELFNIRSALRIHESDWKKEGVPFLRGRELVKLSRTGILDSDVHISDSFYKELKDKGGVPKAGDILITAVGTLGKTYIVTGREGEFYYKDAYILCLENYGLDSAFVKIVLESPFSQKVIYDSSSKGTTVAQLTISKMKSMLLPVPPIEEQHRIVARVEELMAKIDEYEKLENKLAELKKKFPEEMKASILQAAIEGKLTSSIEGDTAKEKYLETILKEERICSKKDSTEPDDGNYPFDIPDEWSWLRLNDIVAKEIRRGKSPKYAKTGQALAFAQKCNSKYEGIKLDLAQHLDDKSLDRYSDVDNMQNLDIVINSTGGGTLGRVGLYEDKYNVDGKLIFPDSHVTVIRAKKAVNPYYLHYCMKYYSPYLETLGEGSTNQTELKPVTLKNLYVPVPPLEEQQRIVDKLDSLLPLCDELAELA